MNPNYEKMEFWELRNYSIENRDDIEAIRALMSRRNPDSKGYPLPLTEELLQQQTAIIKQKIKEVEEKRKKTDR